MGRAARRRCSAARSAGCSTPSPRSPSASTTSSPASRSTSWRPAWRATCPTSLFDGAAGGGADPVPAAADQVPHVSRARPHDSLSDLEQQHWFLVSDLAGVLRGLLHRRVAVTVLAVLLLLALTCVAAVEHRRSACASARSARTPRPRRRSASTSTATSTTRVIISGALAGLGGAFLSTVTATIYREGQTGGRGYIGLAAMIFGNWRPGRPRRRRACSSATPTRCSCAAAATSVHALLLLRRRVCCVAIWPCCDVRQAARGRWRSSSPSLGACRSCGTSPIDELPSRLTVHARRTSRRWWCSRSPRNGCDRPRPTACRTGEGEAHDAGDAATSTGRRCAAAAVERDAPRVRAVLAASRSARPALVDDGRIVVGCNVENASYGLGAVRRVRPGLRACTPPAAAGWSPSPASTATARRSMPCGRCRQLLWEYGGPDLLIDDARRPAPMAELLPYAFGARDLTRSRAGLIADDGRGLRRRSTSSGPSGTAAR